MDPKTALTSSLQRIREKYDFRPDVLDVVVGGRSTIDMPDGIQLKSFDEATRFMASYGYDFDNPIERAEILGCFHEALNFVRRHFLQPENAAGLKLEIPRRILELTDIRELLMMASVHAGDGEGRDAQAAVLRGWACSLLKVMHTIAHIDKDLRASYFSDIQQQIFDRFYKVIQRDEEGRLFLGESPDDPFRVGLVAFETKPKKSRDSIIIKLLHKPENVAEDIFDRVGIRFVTHTRIGALLVVKYLKDKMIVIPSNIKPSRSRNTLVDISHFRARIADVTSSPELEHLTDGQVEEAMERMAALAPSVNPENPHTSEFYRAIQFTCRQLIKLRNPLYEELREIKSMGKARPPGDEMVRAIEKLDLRYVQREIRFFYPYEVQVVDARSAEENERGRSAHSEYKKAQVQTALKRVMGTLADDVR